MIKRLLIIFIVSIFLLTGCSKKTVDSTEITNKQSDETTLQTEELNKESVSSKINIFDPNKDYSWIGYDMTRNEPHLCYYYEKNGWIYGTGGIVSKDGSVTFCVQKMRNDGSDRVIISENSIASKIIEYEGYIYFIATTNVNSEPKQGLYKAKDSGDNFHLIIEEGEVENFQVFNDSLYYTLVDDSLNQWLYKCDLDGKSSTKVLDEPSWYNYVFDDKIIYQGENHDKQSGENIKIKDLTSGVVKTLTSRHSFWPILDGKNMYYLGSDLPKSESYTLYKLDLQNMNETVLLKDVNGPLQYVDGWLYFYNYSDSKRLYKINNEGKSFQIVLQNCKDIFDVQVKTNCIYYVNGPYDEETNNVKIQRLVVCDTDGSEKYNLYGADGWFK